MVMNDMTDDGKWGAEIAHDGTPQPEWLSNDTVIVGQYGPHVKYVQEYSCKPDPAIDWVWSLVTSYRLPASHPHYQQTRAQTLTAQERLERLEAFAGRIARLDGIKAPETPPFTWVAEARALVAEMEPVVDADEERARDLAAKLAGVTLPASNPVHAGFATAGRVNEYISRPTTEAERMIGCMYRGIKEGRELARGDVA